MNKDLPPCFKMEAGITLGLTAGHQTDTLTYFLPLGHSRKKKTKQVGHTLSLFLLKCLSDAERGVVQ